jgi:hypothetical protein
MNQISRHANPQKLAENTNRKHAPVLKMERSKKLDGSASWQQVTKLELASGLLLLAGFNIGH